jgi:hypothetical protein
LHAARLFNARPKHMVVRTMGIYVYGITPSSANQLGIFDDVRDVIKSDYLQRAVDEINDFYGLFTVFSAHTLTGTQQVKQKIPFGGTEYFELLLQRS